MAPHAWKIARGLRRHDEDECEGDERGAEMVEFAIVVVLLIMLLYGIITYGLILAAQATVTQAAADAARAGLTVGSATAVSVAETQAGTDVGWMNKGTCGTSGTAHHLQRRWRRHAPRTPLETCLKVTVTYNYSSNPLFPELPGLGIITPSTISSTNVLQLN